ncbi:WhiB family transcriptional regulator [Streptomyces sp. NPDC058008]|uniref:WhiB family transcriptional regulator n=1 Tax=Streptomyces sp. NPDC058008 TaxID=3346303 RepID=UPI0036E88E46
MTTRTLPRRRSTTFAVSSRESGDWRYRGLCKTADADLFFPTVGGGEAEQKTAAAKRLCAKCPVRAQCLQAALDAGEEFGVFGGLDRRERRRLLSGAEGLDDAVEAYLAGESKGLSSADRLAAIAVGVRQGMSYTDFDVLYDLGQRATSKFVCQMRKRCAERGVEFPAELALVPRVLLTDDQVLRIRNRSAAGATDEEISRDYPVTRRMISRVVTGEAYAEVGGPLRTRVSSSGVAARVGLVQRDMEEAA